MKCFLTAAIVLSSLLPCALHAGCEMNPDHEDESRCANHYCAGYGFAQCGMEVCCMWVVDADEATCEDFWMEDEAASRESKPL